MCKAHEQMKHKVKVETAIRMLKMHQFDLNVIAEVSNLTIDEVKQIEASMLVPA